jgi:hypothetical protein
MRANPANRNFGPIATPPPYLAPVIRAADRIDDRIRRYVVPFEDVSPPRRPRLDSAFQSTWLSAIGQCLKLQYEDALAVPLPPRLATLITQLENRT